MPQQEETAQQQDLGQELAQAWKQESPQESQDQVSPKESPQESQEGQDQKPTDSSPLPQDQRLSRHYAELAKRDRELRERHVQLQAAEKELNDYKQLQAKLKQDPYTAVRELGIDPVEMAKRYLGAEEKPPLDDRISKELADLRSHIEKQNQYIETQKREQFVQTEKQKINQLVRSNNKKYEILSDVLNDSVVDQLFDAAVMEYRETGKQPSYESICDRAEEIYEENLLKSIEFGLKIDRIKNKIGKPPNNTNANNKPIAKENPRTLTSRMQDSSSEDVREMTDDELHAQFVKDFKKSWKEDN